MFPKGLVYCFSRRRRRTPYAGGGDAKRQLRPCAGSGRPKSPESCRSTLKNLRDGFSFLGFHFRTYSRVKHSTGYGLRIKPERTKVVRLRAKIIDVFKEQNNSSAYSLILALNPILRGWANYYRSVISKKARSGAID